jgi:UDP-N-acetylmuramoyl-tripeptide--D-alanyl-D-alanine ligase
MKATALSEIAARMDGALVALVPGVMAYGFATDHREVREGDIFLAIKGARVDGHDYAEAALSQGAVAVVCESPIEGPHILVDNLVAALARFGSSYRAEFEGPVVGVTGSAGKTSAKEFIAAALSPLGSILKTPGNRNTEYTSPLVWAEAGADTSAAVIEMSMRGFGQIRHLAEISRPDIAVITNIGHAHIETVGDRDGIARAKGEILEALPNDGAAILWAEDDYLSRLLEMAGERAVITFGFSTPADCRIIEYKPISWTRCSVKGFFDNLPWSAEVPAVGRHMALNAAAAVATATVIGVSPQEAADCLSDAELPPMRMQVLERDGVTILLDTYNASPGSMASALETFMEMPATGRRLAIIGQMNELGDASEGAHRDLGEALGKLPLDDVLLYGPLSEVSLRASGRPWRRAGDLDEIRAWLNHAQAGDVVLVKGSRSLELEQAL